MKKSIVLTLLCLVLGLLVAACGDDDDDSGGGDKSGNTAGPSGKTGRANIKKVDMKDIQFVPTRLTVVRGTTVQWTNSDDVTHTVTKADGPGSSFDSKDIDAGKTFERNFTEKGTINYFCKIHSNQKGAIVVQ